MTLVDPELAPHPLLPQLARFEHRKRLAADAAPQHMAATEAVDPDPAYTPRHRRTTP